MSQNLLVELFVEELPPKALQKLGEAFSNTLFESLKSQGLTSSDSVVTSFATPRRLAVNVTNAENKAEDKNVAVKLMPYSVGFDVDFNVKPALLKKLESMGEDSSAVKRLRTEHDGKNNNLFLDVTQTGATLQDALQKALDEK